jgi:hypothetical protein
MICADMRIQQEEIPEDINFPHIKSEPDGNRTHSVHIVQVSSGESHVTLFDVACNSRNTYSSNSLLLKLHATTQVFTCESPDEPDDTDFLSVDDN